MIILCYLKALLTFLCKGIWVVHMYGKSQYKKTTIIATNSSFRESDNYNHESNESVYKDAYLITNTCLCCGKKEYSWCRNEFYDKYFKDEDQMEE